MPAASFPRLTDKAKPFVTQALKAEAAGERVTWDVSVAAFPDPSADALPNEDGDDPSGSNVFLPVVVLYLEVPVGDTGQSVYTSSILAPFAINKENVSFAVKSGLATIITRRDQLLAELTETSS